jgi:hypothetical protein
MLNQAEHWLHAEVFAAANLEGLARQDAVRELFRHAAHLDKFALAEFKTLMGKIGVKGQTFNDMLKAAQSLQTEQEKGEDMPEVLNDSIHYRTPFRKGLRGCQNLLRFLLPNKRRSRKCQTTSSVIVPYVRV